MRNYIDKPVSKNALKENLMETKANIICGVSKPPKQITPHTLNLPRDDKLIRFIKDYCVSKSTITFPPKCIPNVHSGYWDYTKVSIRHVDEETPIVIYNNYQDMITAFFFYNENPYFFCQHDYLGFSFINLISKRVIAILPEQALDGHGFTLTKVLSFDEETLTFLVEGCFWACPYEVYKIKLDSIEEPSSIEYTYCRDA